MKVKFKQLSLKHAIDIHSQWETTERPEVEPKKKIFPNKKWNSFKW